MPRAIWSGSVSFGLVNVPVRLFNATSDKDVHFHQLDEKSGSRIRYRKVSEKTGREVPEERIVSAYELDDGNYVTLTDEEMDAAEPERTHTIDIEDFVALEEIDPIQVDRTYWLVPEDQQGAKKAYALLREALERSERVGIGRFVLRTKEHLVAIRPLQNALVVHTMRFGDEVVKASSLDGLPVRAKVGDRELSAAEKLIDSLATTFDPKRYRDTHRDRLLKVIERKAEGEEIVVEEAPQKEAEVVDLMAALEESVKNASKSRSRSRKSGSKRAKKSA
ncbi:MAG TPA: Ku protein [Acidimicrobiales bacterium]|nr:Ku protein [Acidimicrobiales bacterium]